jgi:hypothetical protein
MAEPSKPKRVKRKEAEAVETVPDAWERFESAVKAIAPEKRSSQKQKERSDEKRDEA